MCPDVRCCANPPSCGLCADPDPYRHFPPGPDWSGAQFLQHGLLPFHLESLLVHPRCPSLYLKQTSMGLNNLLRTYMAVYLTILHQLLTVQCKMRQDRMTVN
jgi:hypothetical protein